MLANINMFETAAANKPTWYKVESHVHQQLHKQNPLAVIHIYFSQCANASVMSDIKRDLLCILHFKSSDLMKVKEINTILSPMLKLNKQDVFESLRIERQLSGIVSACTAPLDNAPDGH